MADAVQVLDHRHAAFAHQALDQAAAAARHQQVEVLRHCDQQPDRRAIGAADQLHRLGRQADVAQPGRDQPRQQAVALYRLRAATQDCRIAALDAQSGGVDRDVWAAFIDDADDADRHAHPADPDSGRLGTQLVDCADRVRQLDHSFEPGRHLLHRGLGQRQAIDRRCVESRCWLRMRPLDVARVGRQQRARFAAQRGGNRGEGAVAGAAVGPSHQRRRSTRRLADALDLEL